MAESAEDRRARAALEPNRWRVGGSPGTDGCTIYQGTRFVGSVRHPRDAAYLVAVANEYQRANNLTHPDPTGDRLDAERRGYVVQPEDMMCSNCDHHSVAHTADGCGFEDCGCKRSWSDLRG